MRAIRRTHQHGTDDFASSIDMRPESVLKSSSADLLTLSSVVTRHFTRYSTFLYFCVASSSVVNGGKISRNLRAEHRRRGIAIIFVV